MRFSRSGTYQFCTGKKKAQCTPTYWRRVATTGAGQGGWAVPRLTPRRVNLLLLDISLHVWFAFSAHIIRLLLSSGVEGFDFLPFSLFTI